MIFRETSITGAFLVESEPSADWRGSFARTFCEREFSERGLATTVAQCSISQNLCRGILRGLHYQAEPYSEVKLVRCLTGAIYDVIVDLRPESPTFKCVSAFELSRGNGFSLYIPK